MHAHTMGKIFREDGNSLEIVYLSIYKAESNELKVNKQT